MDFQQLADKALEGIIPERQELKAVLNASEEQIPELLSAAFKVRHHYYGKRVQIHVLQNAKSGLCPEDCHYCSQSSVSEAPIDRYPFMSKEKLVESAKQAKAAGAVRFCIVNSGRGPTNKEIDEIADAVREIREKTGMNICCSLGLMNEEKTRVAGGREINLRSLQPLSLYPANSLFVNGYLTTPGQEASDAHQMIADLGFELDQPAAI